MKQNKLLLTDYSNIFRQGLFSQSLIFHLHKDGIISNQDLDKINDAIRLMNLKSIDGYYASHIFINTFSTLLNGKDFDLINDSISQFIVSEINNVHAFVKPVISYLKKKG